jgi:hypothetical protein
VEHRKHLLVLVRLHVFATRLCADVTLVFIPRIVLRYWHCFQIVHNSDVLVNKVAVDLISEFVFAAWKGTIVFEINLD